MDTTVERDLVIINVAYRTLLTSASVTCRTIKVLTLYNHIDNLHHDGPQERER